MAGQKFPLKPNQSVGRFWVVGADEKAGVDGVCRVDDEVIEVEVASPLTEWMEKVHDLNSVTLRPKAEDQQSRVTRSYPNKNWA